MEKEMLRSEQKIENTWDLSKIYASISDYEKDYDVVKKLMADISKYQTHILDSSKSLLELLDLDQKTERIIGKMANYAYRKYDEDLSNVDSQKLVGNFDKLYTEYSQNGSFIVPEILKGDYSLIEKYIKEEEGLKEYELLLKRIFRNKPHVLSEKEENGVTCVSNTVSFVDNLLADSNIDKNLAIYEKDVKEKVTNIIKADVTP